MSWLHQLAVDGRLSDRRIRLVFRRLALRRLARATKAAAGPPDRRLGHLLERTALGGPWHPGEQPEAIAAVGLEDELLGDRGPDATGHWPRWAPDMATANHEMLALIRRRAALAEGQEVLLVARRRCTAASELAEDTGSEPRVWTARREDADRIHRQALRQGHGQVEVRSGPLRETIEEGAYDRILAIESLPAGDPRPFLSALASRLRPGGLLFLQLACHRRYAYPISAAEARWLSTAAGALIPATDLAPRLVPELVLRHHWELSGEHYERTFRARRERLESRRRDILSRAAPRLGEKAARRAIETWRIALLTREVMFGLRGGQEWWISQYALERPQT